MKKSLIGFAMLAFAFTAQAVDAVDASLEKGTALVSVNVKSAENEIDYTFRSFVGSKNSAQYSGRSGANSFAAAVSVMAIKPDNTAYVVIDFNENGQEKHVDANVRVNEAVEVVPNNSDVVFHLKVMPASV